MKLLASLDNKDRQMLLITMALVGGLLILLAVFTPGEDPNSNRVPNSYLSGQHGAKAAFTLLQQSGYRVERWEEPLAELAGQANADTVLIVTEPYSSQEMDQSAIAEILQKGGRVLTTGFQGGLLLPGNQLKRSRDVSFAACEARPDGLDPLAGAGSIWIVPNVSWEESRSEIRTAYTCAGEPVVVDFPSGNGTAVWWASSTPLENGSITRGRNLELFFNSVGPAPGKRIYWDESLHGRESSQWDFVKGPVWPLFWGGSLGVTLLVILSFSRRSGPIRPLPHVARTTPIEFLEALGALYRSTGAAATAMQIAWERFRTQSGLLIGQRTSPLDARQIAAAIGRRFGAVAAGLEADLVAAEEACRDDELKPRRALGLIQTLRRHEETMRKASSRAANHVAVGAGVTLGS